MNDGKLVNIARLMTTYNFEIEQLLDNLKCTQCNLVFKDACQVPCGFRFCRVCIDDMMAKGGKFCPGESEDCGESLLSCFSTDYVVNKIVCRLDVKCPHEGCVHKCQFVKIEEHMRECQRKCEDCPFRELGCLQDKLAVEEMDEHLRHENRRHSEILIGMIVNINKEIETLKLRDEVNSREIEILKQKNEVSSREIETLKHDLVLKDGQIRSIMDQMIHVQNENQSIKEEKENIAGRMRIFAEEIQRETAERRENDELDSARVIEHVDREIAAVTLLIRSNKDDLSTKLQLVSSDIGSINADVSSVKSHIIAIQGLVGLEQFDASCVWTFNDDVSKADWGNRYSEYFTGTVHPYKYDLASTNYDIGTARAALRIQLCINVGPNDEQLAWPFEGRVVITVTDRDRREACRSIYLQCQIDRPPNNECRVSDLFTFLHSELRGAGLNLSRGVRVSCVIVLGAD